MDELQSALLDRRFAVDDVVARAAGRGRLWLLQRGPFTKARLHRVAVLEESADGLVGILDGIAPIEQVEALAAALAAAAHEIVRGDWDAMWGTPWTHAWAGDPLRIYRPDGLVARADAHGVTVGGRHVHGVTGVIWYVARGWTEVGVAVEAGGERIVVASVPVDADPTEGIELWADPAWAQRLAGVLGDVFRVPSGRES